MNIEKSQLSEDQNDSSESYKPEKLNDVRKKRATNTNIRAKNEEPKDKTKSKKTKNTKPQNKREKKDVLTQSESKWISSSYRLQEKRLSRSEEPILSN